MRRRTRQGFTLIELIVAMGIIALLSSLLYFAGPAVIRTQSASRGAELVQGTAFNTKQTALRDGVLYGFRLLTDTNGNYTRLQYITQPTDYVGNPNSVMVVAGNPNQVQFASDITDGLTDPTLRPIQKGDYLLLPSGPVFPTLITGVGPPAGLPANVVQTQGSNAGGPTTYAPGFRVLRGPRPVSGEDIIQLPDDVIIDPPAALGTGGGSLIDPNPTTGNFEVLFSPAGAVVSPSGRRGKIVLWVRDGDYNRATAREQSLITIFSRSGAIGSYEVDTGSGNPYAFTFDPRPNGL